MSLQDQSNGLHPEQSIISKGYISRGNGMNKQLTKTRSHGQASRVFTGAADRIQLRESRDPQKERLVKRAQKTQFDKRRSQKFPEIGVGDEILVRTGLPPHNKTYGGPYVIKRIELSTGCRRDFPTRMTGKKNKLLCETQSSTFPGGNETVVGGVRGI